ncbi:unnamed protein product [Rotaria sordida]|uniref:Uncharacterized protein n=1 Tax=Rotaria sordida TaxID=392033 RepID=A0A818PUV9_9BILA|nr:unnamed protein product [Rotaria sordida]CAF3631093.1 unnamed protein product [Rotaria sordida]
MLLATTIMLLVFRSPSAVISVMWLISAKMFINEKAPFRLRKFHSIANLCATLNAATTFIMFIIYGTKFRSEFTHVYCYYLNKIKKKKKIKKSKHEHEREQQMKQLISYNYINNKDNLNNQSKRTFHQEIIQSNDNTTTTLATTNSFPLFKYINNTQRKREYSYEKEFHSINHINDNINHQQNNNHIQYENDNYRKSSTLRLSYDDCLKRLINCR